MPACVKIRFMGGFFDGHQQASNVHDFGLAVPPPLSCDIFVLF